MLTSESKPAVVPEIAAMYRQSVVRWKESAADWRAKARAALAQNDISLAIFSHNVAQDCERYAAEDYRISVGLPV